MQSSLKTKVLAVCAAAIVMGGGIAGVTAATASEAPPATPAASPAEQPIAAAAPSAPKYEVNPQGQTFGSAVDARSDAELPDLILAWGVDGTLGYVLGTDRLIGSAASPEEAAKLPAPTDRLIPLYASDGKTVIGQFRITPGVVEAR